MKKRTVLVLAFLLTINTRFVLAATVTIPLPGLTGSVHGQTVPFDFGINFLSIQSVTCQCTGSITPGVGCGDGVERPVFPYFDWPAQITLYMDTDPGYCSASIGLYDGPFNVNQALQPHLGATWNFLLDGKAEIKAYMSPFIIIGGVMLESPSANISQVYLTIEGTFISPLEIVTPEANEPVLAGSTCKIEWQDTRGLSNCPGNYLLEYSTDNGSNWTAINQNPVSNICSYDWMVPVIDSNQCLIRIIDADNPDINGTSGNRFYIYQCQINNPSDLNHDCYVDFYDFAILAQSWCNCGNPYDPSCGN